MSELLQELVGRRVWFWTTVGPSDLGTLDAAGNRWISMTSAVNGLLLLPLANIRLIKIVGGGMAVQAVSGEIAPSLLGRKVTVSSISGESTLKDTGELEAFDEDWLRVRVKNDQLYFPASSIAELRLL